ncbi:hypothetical protein AB4Y32_29530 [Paraburkholderia phymatum]|uniref:Uncharacterized protein n=1 Tax=Paraburkholderia phymatum TaxID=148447 RepID=A0ACC6U8C5_9BURK
MSGYLERIASLAVGAGPRLRPLPRYRFGDAQAWAHGDPGRPWLDIEQAAERSAPVDARDDVPDTRHAVRDAARVETPPFDDQGVPVRTALANRARACVPDGLDRPGRPDRPDGRLLAQQPDPGPAAETSSLQPAQAAPTQRSRDDREPLVPALADPRARAALPRIEARHGPLHDGEPRSLRQSAREPGRERLRPSDRHAAQADGPPTVIVRIGHIDVRAQHASPPAAPAREPEGGLRNPSLDAYLKTRDRGRP